MKSIDILGQPVKIKRVSLDTLSKNHGDEGENVFGYYSSTERSIYVASELTGDTFRRILLHEIMHAYLGISGVSSVLSNSQLEECLCDLFENSIFLFKDKMFTDLMNGTRRTGNAGTKGTKTLKGEMNES